MVFLKGGLTKHKVFHQTGAGSDCKCFASAVAKRQLCIVEILVMEEQREGWWERFCLDMEAQEADRQVNLGSKSEASIYEVSSAVPDEKVSGIQVIQVNSLTGPLQGKKTPGQETERTST